LSKLLRLVGLAWAGLAGCNQVLGIEESFVDPSLDPSGVEGGRATGGAPSDDEREPAGGAPGGAGQSGLDAVGGASAGAAGAPTTDDLCQDYCSLMGDHCVGAAAQYRDEAQCLTICRTFPPGQLDDDNVNTASCRRRYASKARYLAGLELATDCANAGPGGNGRCGGYCDGLCTVTMAACSADLSAPFFYGSVDECLAACEGLPSSRYQYATASSGNSVECRLFHASSAIMADADEHCEHALGITLCAE
jgi:hypothetical protein